MWMKFGSPPSYWISGLYFPQGFMTGCLQRHARQYSIPIDTLKVDFELTSIVLIQEEIADVHAISLKDEHSAYKGLMNQEDGVYIHGLFLDAGRIDLVTKRLVNPIPGNKHIYYKTSNYINNMCIIYSRRHVSFVSCHTTSANC